MPAGIGFPTGLLTYSMTRVVPHDDGTDFRRFWRSRDEVSDCRALLGPDRSGEVIGMHRVAER